MKFLLILLSVSSAWVAATQLHAINTSTIASINPTSKPYGGLLNSIGITSHPAKTITETTTSFPLRTTSGSNKVADTTVALQMQSADECNLVCNKSKFILDPVCATNGFCIYQFPNQCVLDAFNCLCPEKKFHSVQMNECQMPWIMFCPPIDLTIA